MTTIPDFARRYAARGFPVFPTWPIVKGKCGCGATDCPHPGKHPHGRLAPHGLKDATTEVTVIGEWWTKEPSANLSIATGKRSGVVVLDIDPRNGGDASLAALEAKHGPLPPTLTVDTGGGGSHLYFAAPAFPVKSTAGVLAPGIDVRAEGGSVVAPPSVHLTGKRYAWRKGCPKDPAALSAWIEEVLRPKAAFLRAPSPVRPSTGDTPYGLAALERECRGVETAGNGKRNETLNRASFALGQLVAGGELCSGTAEAGLTAAGIAAGLGEREVREVVPRGMADGMRDPRSALPPATVRTLAPLAPRPESLAPPVERAWPVLHDAALSGLAGDIIRTLLPHTESDPAALLFDLLAAVGNIIGDGPHVLADGNLHPPRLFVAVVGKTGRGRKGTARANVKRLLADLDPEWEKDCQATGLSTGEGLITKLAGNGGPASAPAPSQKGEGQRVFVYEPEFARTLKVCAREANILSAIIRAAWDDMGNLSILTRKDPLMVPRSMVSMVTNITREELLRCMPDTETANGFANRYLFVMAKRSKRLPSGGRLPSLELKRLRDRLGGIVAVARGVGEVRRSEAAEALWADIYTTIDDDADGMFGAVTARVEAQILRLALLYALLDGSRVIERGHLWAALAAWDYAESSAFFLFGGTSGDSMAERLFAALVAAGEGGLDFTAQRDLFSRHATALQLAVAREILHRTGRAKTVKDDSGGRPREVTRACARKASESNHPTLFDAFCARMEEELGGGEVGEDRRERGVL